MKQEYLDCINPTNHMKRTFLFLFSVLTLVDASAQTGNIPPELARARELSEIDWTPLHDIQLCGKKDRKVAALKPMHGMLYSSTSEHNQGVPYDVSIYTFLTCLHNPYSLLYTESRNPNYPRSAYGFEYHGGKTSGAWMGCVCSIFSSYVAGFEFQYVSRRHENLCKKGILSRPDEQSSQGVERFDILWQKGHCRAVTDVVRSADGSVTAVEISESKSPVVVRQMYSAQSFDSLMNARQIVIYRRADMSRQGHVPVYYMPSPIVYNDAICTFSGDRAAFRKGSTIVIHCLDRSCRKMALYRSGKLVRTIKLTSKMLVNNRKLDIRGNEALDPGAYAVDLTPLNLDYGKYEACLVRGDSRSEPTRFEIIDCEVRYEGDRLYFSSHNSVPVFWTKNGLHYLISDTQNERGWIKASGVNEKSGVSVTFQGEYGRVCRRLEL